jgi:hypothetical protein
MNDCLLFVRLARLFSAMWAPRREMTNILLRSLLSTLATALLPPRPAEGRESLGDRFEFVIQRIVCQPFSLIFSSFIFSSFDLAFLFFPFRLKQPRVFLPCPDYSAIVRFPPPLLVHASVLLPTLLIKHFAFPSLHPLQPLHPIHPFHTLHTLHPLHSL